MAGVKGVNVTQFLMYILQNISLAGFRTLLHTVQCFYFWKVFTFKTYVVFKEYI